MCTGDCSGDVPSGHVICARCAAWRTCRRCRRPLRMDRYSDVDEISSTVCRTCLNKTNRQGGGGINAGESTSSTPSAGFSSSTHALDGILSRHELHTNRHNVSLEGFLRLNEGAIRDIIRNDLRTKR